MPTRISRHGLRAPGQTVVTFALPLSLKNEIRKIARADGATPSDWMRVTLRDRVRRHYAALRAHG